LFFTEIEAENLFEFLKGIGIEGPLWRNKGLQDTELGAMTRLANIFQCGQYLLSGFNAPIFF
jgi:hypothetical protein